MSGAFSTVGITAAVVFRAWVIKEAAKGAANNRRHYRRVGYTQPFSVENSEIKIDGATDGAGTGRMMPSPEIVDHHQVVDPLIHLHEQRITPIL
jgi:hypothetical protein